jgi:hypothetical protein
MMLAQTTAALTVPGEPQIAAVDSRPVGPGNCQTIAWWRRRKSPLSAIGSARVARLLSFPVALAVTFLLAGGFSFAASNVEVYVAYADNEHLLGLTPFLPNPWYGSPNTTFLGYPTSPPSPGTLLAWDTGAIMIRNTGTRDVVLGQLATVNGFNDPNKVFTLWDSTQLKSNLNDGLLGANGIGPNGIIIPPGQQLILAQTGAANPTNDKPYIASPCPRTTTPGTCGSNFDSSDTPNAEKNVTNTPVIHLTLDNVTWTFTDTAQILNVGGTDVTTGTGNESVQWRLIGTTGSSLPGGSGVNPPAVTTWHNDNSRTGLNRSETTLTPLVVTCPSPHTNCNFGKLFSYPVDGPIFAQPLFVPNVAINGTKHNTVFVTTINNSVYAFDAESAVPVNNGQPLWVQHFGSTGPPPGFTVFGTPVIDTTTNTLYLVSNSNGVTATLYALDLSSGNHKFNSPSNISGAVFGSGDGSVPVEGPPRLHGPPATFHVITFNTVTSVDSAGLATNNLYQRPALLLYGGSVYVAFGSGADTGPYHGWLFGYDASNVAKQTQIFNSTPNGNPSSLTSATDGTSCRTATQPAGGAFWMSGAGPAADETGIFATTGNGTFDANHDYGDSVIRLTPALQPIFDPHFPRNPFGINLPNPMGVADYYTPYNQADLNCVDTDLGSSGPLLIPNTNPPLVAQVNKAGTIYLLNRKALGKFTACPMMGCPQTGGPPFEPIVQALTYAIGQRSTSPLSNEAVYGSPAYFNNTVYFKANQDYLKAFQLVNGQFATTPVAQSGASTGTAWATPSISYDSNAPSPSTSTALVWTVEAPAPASPGAPAPAVLHAYLASSLQEIYSDAVGNPVNFKVQAVPTVAAGKVFIGTQDQLVVYGAGQAFPIPTGSLTVALQVVPGNSPATLDLLVDDALQLHDVGNNATTLPLSLASGAHTVRAVLSSPVYGFNPWISYKGSCDATGRLTIQPGSTATCTVAANMCPIATTWSPSNGSCINACGGASRLLGTVGGSCKGLTCAGQLACAGPDSLICEPQTNVCGGCSSLPKAPGQGPQPGEKCACTNGLGGRYYCTPSKELSCDCQHP